MKTRILGLAATLVTAIALVVTPATAASNAGWTPPHCFKFQGVSYCNPAPSTGPHYLQ